MVYIISTIKEIRSKMFHVEQTASIMVSFKINVKNL